MKFNNRTGLAPGAELGWIKSRLAAIGGVFALFFLGFAEMSLAQTNVTPDQWLSLQPRPVFASSYQLPALTKDGWPLSSNLNVAAAQYYGYALDLGELNSDYPIGLLQHLTNAGTFENGLALLASNNPTQFKMSIHSDRHLGSTLATPGGYWCTNTNGWFVDGVHSWQYLTNTQYTPIPCPDMQDSDSYWQAISTAWANNLKAVRAVTPIAIVLNDGEYGMQEFGDSGLAWSQDPRVQKDAGTNTFPQSPQYLHENWWTHYAAVQKSHQLGMQTTAYRQSVPDRQLYIYYNTGDEQTRVSANPLGCNVWGFDSTVFVTNSDLPSFECYYQGWAGHDYTNETGQSGDLLTEYLNAVGFNLKLGYSNNYSWLCGGWAGNGSDDPAVNSQLSPIPLYVGFLKCLYTSGMVGGIAGYYSYPTNSAGFNATFPTNSPPHWLLQIQALGQVHALFSHLENFLYNGDLLSGPQSHRFSTDQPAYEFTNSAADATARVLARKLRDTNQWLVTAWASAGPDRNVTVTIPVLGQVQVLARASGAVYQATTTNLTLVDVNGMLPTASFAPPLSPPSNLHVISSGPN